MTLQIQATLCLIFKLICMVFWGSAEPKANLFLLPLPDFWFLRREFYLRDLFKDN